MAFVLMTTRRFERSFRKLEQAVRERVLSRVRELADNPYIGRRLATRPVWYIRVGDYRVFYHIDEERKLITLIDVAHRRAAYRR
ncbi:type II toxin-antitoxin system RelE/ParE family toxin [Candidatus Bathyarchaeota archaeon]|mgnify:CR=1 FL=1|nr:MAG: type II toxin-antitoxin system RelE/ParE family toxin [Candidatus Bathyarchaeota archaeon]